jgi:hypothetical protein
MKKLMPFAIVIVGLTFWYITSQAFFGFAFWKKNAAAPAPSAVLTITPNEWVFGIAGTIKTFQVKNTGTATSASLTATISMSTRYTLSADGCTGNTLAVNATCNVTVNFNNGGSPPNDGCYMGQLTVADGVATAYIPMSGEARDSNGIDDCGILW